MGSAAEKIQPGAEKATPETKVLKISSKRQVTIPADWCREEGFTDYALVTRTEEGLVFEPLEVKSEDATVKILGELIDRGYEGEELLARYKEANGKLKSTKELIEEAIADIDAGRVVDFDEMMAKPDAKHGLSD